MKNRTLNYIVNSALFEQPNISRVQAACITSTEIHINNYSRIENFIALLKPQDIYTHRTQPCVCLESLAG